MSWSAVVKAAFKRFGGSDVNVKTVVQVTITPPPVQPGSWPTVMLYMLDGPVHFQTGDFIKEMPISLKLKSDGMPYKFAFTADPFAEMVIIFPDGSLAEVLMPLIEKDTPMDVARECQVQSVHYTCVDRSAVGKKYMKQIIQRVRSIQAMESDTRGAANSETSMPPPPPLRAITNSPQQKSTVQSTSAVPLFSAEQIQTVDSTDEQMSQRGKHFLDSMNRVAYTLTSVAAFLNHVEIEKAVGDIPAEVIADIASIYNKLDRIGRICGAITKRK